jgi:hypothetical protein
MMITNYHRALSPQLLTKIILRDHFVTRKSAPPRGRQMTPNLMSGERQVENRIDIGARARTVNDWEFITK